jgi:hypothetical protein
MQIRVASLLAAAAATAIGFSANAQLINSGVVIERASTPPGAPNDFFPTFAFDNAAINNDGRILFTGILDNSGAGGATTANRRCLFYGTPGNMQLLARDGQTGAADTMGNPLNGPTLPNPNNWVHNTTTNGAGLVSNAVMTPNGTIFVSSSLNGSGATTTNNTAFWTGPAGGLSIVAQRGHATLGLAPGTAGASFNSNMNLSTTQQRVNSNGQVLFQSSLTGGDVSGTTNNDGIFLMSPTSKTLIARKGSQAPGFGDPNIKFGGTGTQLALNTSGSVGFVSPLLNGSGGVTTSNDSVMWSNNSGTLRPVAREGDATSFAGINYGSSFSFIGQPMDRQGNMFFINTVTGAGVTSNVNDQVIFKYDGSSNSLAPILRRGDASFVAGASYSAFNNSNTKAMTDGSLLMCGGLNQDGTLITADNDTYIAIRKPDGSIRPVVREGGLAAAFGSIGNLGGLPADAVITGSSDLASGSSAITNALGQVVFQASISGTGVTANVDDRCLFAFDPNVGLILVARTGSQMTPNTGVATQFSYYGTVNGDGTSYALSDTGWLAYRGSDSFGNNVIFRTQIIPAPATALVGLASLLAVGRRRRR